MELKTLTDLAFIVQDYETVCQNVDFPINDLSSIKAFKYSTHCEEI